MNSRRTARICWHAASASANTHSREGCSYPLPVSTRMMVRSQSRHARTTTTWLMSAVTRALSQSSHPPRVNDPSALTQC